MPKLDTVVIVFETEASCHDHLVEHGYPSAIAREIATYLAQATDLADVADEIRTALRAETLEVRFLSTAEAAEALPRLDPDRSIVWCLTDGIRYYRGASIPALVRLLGLARYGSPAPAQHICQDKLASLAMAQSAGLPIPPTRLLEGTSIVASLGEAGLDWSRATLFVKPATLGAKLGIFADSRCLGFEAATRLTNRIWERYGDRAVVQAYIEGDDVRLSYMATGGTFERQVGIGRLRKDPASETGGAFMTMRDNETLSGARDVHGGRGAFGRAHAAAFTPAMDDLRATEDPQAKQAAAAILDHANRLRRLLPLHDYFSMDFRIDADGRPMFLEFETCPAVTIYDFQHYLATMHGLKLGTALAKSMRLSFERFRSRAEA